MSFLNIGQRSWFDIFVVLAAGLVSGSRWALSTCLVNERLWIFTSSIYLENTVSVRCLLETTKLHSIWFREKSSLLHSLWVTQSVVHKTEKPILGDRIRSEGKNNKAGLVLCIPPVLNIVHGNLLLNTSDKRNWIPLLPPVVPIAQRHVQRRWGPSRFFSSYLKSGADLSDWRSQRNTL